MEVNTSFPPPTHTHTHTYTHITQTHKDTSQKRLKKSLAAVKMVSETPGYLGTSQALRASAGKSTWGRASIPQVGLYHVPG